MRPDLLSQVYSTAIKMGSFRQAAKKAAGRPCFLESFCELSRDDRGQKKEGGQTESVLAAQSTLGPSNKLLAITSLGKKRSDHRTEQNICRTRTTKDDAFRESRTTRAWHRHG
uniref:Uncharacterized protein n=1 Tax=Cyanoptyche gloeocystis TaxID=77922 RepID=A0A7S2JL90_9EUKA